MAGSLHIRLGEDLQARLDDEARRRGLTRSQVTRILIEAGLGSSETDVLLTAISFRMKEVTQSLVSLIAADITDRLPAIVEQLAEDLDEDGE